MIIGFCGKAGSGKDTAADVLVQSYSFKKIAFADALKRVCKEYFYLTNEELYVNKTKKSRCILQGVGVLLRDKISKDFWIDQVFNNINENDSIVISDVRFPNEVEAIKKRKGIIIKISRFLLTDIEFNSNHISERVDLLKEDYSLINENGKRDSFQIRVAALVNSCGRRQ